MTTFRRWQARHLLLAWAAYWLALAVVALGRPLALVWALTRDAAGRWRAAPSFVPTLVEAGPPIRLVDLPRALARGDLPASTRARYRAALDRTTTTVRSLGPKVPVLDGPLPGAPASAEQLAGP